MSDNITMNIKQLKNEVQLLRDELAIMKRKYEDIIYNLDTDNFSQRVVKQGKDMYSKIEQNAEGISLQAEKVEENKQSLAEIKVTANEIQEAVFEKNDDGTKTSRITQTANLITSEVEKLNNKDTELSTKINQTAESINLQATKIEENTSKVADLSVKAGEISSMTKVNISAYFEKDEAPTKENTSTAQKAMLCLYKGVHYYYNDITEEWEVYPQTGLKTLFVQDGDGFKIYGDVKIDGSCILTDSLTFNASDKPVQVEYSADGTPDSWHTSFVSGSDKFMRLKIGSQWSDAMKVVGTDGRNGSNGSPGDDATVTPEAVFAALTDNGANQGIFAAFVKNNNQIYINAEFLYTQIAKVADILCIGESGSNEEKKIQFQSGAFISTYKDWTGNPPTGIRISASTLDLSGCSEIYWGDHLSDIGGTATAVFG